MSKYPKLDEYIKKAIDNGKTKDQLGAEMKKSGYNDEDIKSVLSVFPDNSTNSTVGGEIPTKNTKKKLYIPISIALIILIILGGVFYSLKAGLFSSAPYDQSNLFSGLAQKISKMETFSYTFSGSFIAQDRDSDAKPFEPIGNTVELKEKYYRDYQRGEFLKKFTRKYRSGSFPENLKSIDEEVYVYDPLTNETYDYKQIDDGEDFEVSITFETSDAIDSAISSNKIYSNRSYRDYDSILVEGKTLTFSKDTPVIYLDSKPPKNFYESLSEELELAPDDIDVSASIGFKTDTAGDSLDFAADFIAEGDLGDLIYKVDANAIKKDENFYVKLNNFPSMLLFFFPIEKGEWILVGEESFIEDFFAEDFPENDKYKDDIKIFYSRIFVLADENELLNIKNNPSKDKVNNENAYKYELEINGDALEPFLNDVISEFENGDYNFSSGILDDQQYHQDIEHLQEYIKNEEFENVLNYYNENTENILWVNDSGYIVKFESSNRLVPNSDRLSDRQFMLTLAVELNDINEEVNIEAPSEYKTLEELEESSYGPLESARNSGEDARIKANLSNIRASAELAYDYNDSSYGKKAFPLGVCRPVENTLFAESNIASTLESLTGEDSEEPMCISTMENGSVNSWAISAPLVTDPDYSFCVDSSGNAIEILGQIKGDSCSE